MSEESQFEADLRRVSQQIGQLIEQADGDAVALLKILRFLEQLHSDIRESHFQPALPIQRHGLFDLLREIETEGGWPYIPRLQLKQILAAIESSAVSAKPE